MKKQTIKITAIRLVRLWLFFSCIVTAAQENTIQMKSDIYSENKTLTDIMRFEDIDYYTTKFTGTALKNKEYYISLM